jgi:hypothetical protein
MPDDALTRLRRVIPHLRDVDFMSSRFGGERSRLYQWLPDEWGTSLNCEEPTADTGNGSSAEN